MVELILTVPCPTCGVGRSPSASGTCEVCSSQLPSELVETVRTAIRERRQAFKGRLNRLEQRMKDATKEASTFPTRGAPLAPQEHLSRVLRPFTTELSTRSATVAQLLGDTRWDEGADERIAAFSKLVTLLDDALTSVSDFRKVMPPIEWRAAHRELARAALEQVRGQIQLTLTIIAPDATAAEQQREAARHSLARGARHAERARAIIEQVSTMPDVDPFQADGSIDMALLAWAGIGREATSITDAAEIVRSSYRDIPNMGGLPDHYAVLLLPVLASARVVDYELLIGRARQFRAVLDRAGDPVSWLTEPELLVVRLQRGLDRITAETERLGREWRHNLPRRHVMNSLTEVYRQLIEGALRDLGSIILVAARAHRGDDNATYEQAVIDGIKAGEVVDELERIGAPCGSTVDMLYRNASAHADITVTDTGIIATERVIKDGRVEKSTTTALSDDEFYEELVALQEMLLALQLTLLPWAYADSRLNAALATTRPSLDQMTRVLALLGGMAGLSDVMVSVVGDHLIVAAGLVRSDRDRREKEILSLVPAAFGAMPEANRVTLDIAGLKSVPFERKEFESLDSEAPHSLPLLGLTSARWLVQSGFHWTERDEATYVTFPLTMLHFACMRVAGSTPQSTENIDRAVESLRLVLARLDEVLPAEKRSPLTWRALAQVNILTTSLAGLAQARRDQRLAGNASKLGQDAASTTSPMFDIQEEAKALRDGN